MIIEEFKQYSNEYWAAKIGKPGSSSFDKILTPKTMKPSTSAKNYAYTLAGERITGVKIEGYQNTHMERGLETEGEARELFEMLTDIEVKQVGLIYPDERKLYLCSPDGLLMDDREGLEIKCPAIHTHVSYLLAGTIPRDYIPQVQGSMLITGFSIWNFMSYYPGLPPLIIKVKRDDKFCAILKVELAAFCKTLDEVTEKIKGMG